MSTLFRGRRRAEDLAARIDAPVGVAPATADPATDQLLRLVHDLRTVGVADPLATPRPEFVGDLRERLLVEAATVLITEPDTPTALVLPPRPHGRRERRLVAAATAAVLLGGTASMAAAAQHALPGQALYPVKRGIEKADARLARSPEARGRDLLGQASHRLDEVQGLVAAGPTSGSAQIPATLDAFTTQARQGAELLTSSYQRNEDPQAIRTVRDFAARDQDVLTGLARSAPLTAQPSLRRAATALSAIDAQARGTCSDCTNLPALKVPADLAAEVEADRALSRVAGIETLRPQLLDNSHPVPVTGDETGGAPPRQSQHTGRSPSSASGGSAAKAPTATPTPNATATGGALGALSGVGKALTGKSTPAPLGAVTGTSGKKKSGGTTTSGGSGTVPSGPLGDVVGTLLPEVGGAAGGLLGGN